MSSLEEKLGAPARATSGRARRSLESLRTARGYRVLAGPADMPERVAIQPMEERSEWVHASGRGPGAIYEREDA